MNVQTDNNQATISDDQDLAKALAGVNAETPAPEPETPAPTPETEPPAAMDVQMTPPPTPVPQRGDIGDSLDDVKLEAINELRPIIDKLNLPPDEKFDTYLLLIRCTDDRSLVPPAHEVAKQIEDEGRRAQALLDIIKEIEYLSNKPESTAAPADQFSNDLSKGLDKI